MKPQALHTNAIQRGKAYKQEAAHTHPGERRQAGLCGVHFTTGSICVKNTSKRQESAAR